MGVDSVPYLSPITWVAVARGLIWFLSTGTLSGPTLILAGAIAVVAGMATTAGYHRLFSHRSYEASLAVRVWLLIVGLLGLQGSALEWSIDHRAHHKYVDRDKDPYSIKKGFWFAHILWIFKTRPRDFRPSHNADLFRDKFVFFQHRYFMPLAIFMNFALPTAIAGIFWGDALGGFLIARLSAPGVHAPLDLFHQLALPFFRFTTVQRQAYRARQCHHCLLHLGAKAIITSTMNSPTTTAMACAGTSMIPANGPSN